MNAMVSELLAQAMALPLLDRARLIESLMESMSPVDKDIEALWAIEAENRIDALERGEMALEDEPRILAEYRLRRK
jgi:hypothetical protein